RRLGVEKANISYWPADVLNSATVRADVFQRNDCEAVGFCPGVAAGAMPLKMAFARFCLVRIDHPEFFRPSRRLELHRQLFEPRQVVEAYRRFERPRIQHRTNAKCFAGVAFQWGLGVSVPMVPRQLILDGPDEGVTHR